VGKQVSSLAEMIGAGVLTPFEPDSLANVEPDSKTYLTALASLMTLRPMIVENNVVDALNIALTYAMNQTRYFERQEYFVHLTHSRGVTKCMDRIPWESDPLRAYIIYRRPDYMTTRYVCKNEGESESALNEAVFLMDSLDDSVGLLVRSDRERFPRDYIETAARYHYYKRNYFEPVVRRVLEAYKEEVWDLLPRRRTKMLGHAEMLRDRTRYADHMIEAHDKLFEDAVKAKDLLQKYVTPSDHLTPYMKEYLDSVR
jgi:hypothetical protein